MSKNSIILGIAVPIERRRNEDGFTTKNKREKFENGKAEGQKLDMAAPMAVAR